jgi:hypothetical protein
LKGGVLEWSIIGEYGNGKIPRKNYQKLNNSIDLKTEFAIREISDRHKPQIPGHTIDQYAQLQLPMSQTDLSTS